MARGEAGMRMGLKGCGVILGFAALVLGGVLWFRWDVAPPARPLAAESVEHGVTIANLAAATAELRDVPVRSGTPIAQRPVLAFANHLAAPGTPAQPESAP